MEIIIKPSPGNACIRFACTVCGGQTDKTDVPMAFTDPADGNQEFVCERCIARGSAGIKEALLRHADHLRIFAEELRRLAEADFIVPTAEEIDRATRDELPISDEDPF